MDPRPAPGDARRRQVHRGGYQMRLRDFYAYGDDASDDLQLYLFDKKFCEKAPSPPRYSPPNIFADDLFALLGENDRPDHRWLIAGRTERQRVSQGSKRDERVERLYGRKWILLARRTPRRAPQRGRQRGGATGDARGVVHEPYGTCTRRTRTTRAKRTETTRTNGRGRRRIEEDEESSVRRRRRRRRGGGTRPPRVMEGYAARGRALRALRLVAHGAQPRGMRAVTQNFCSPRTLPRVLRFLGDAGECGARVRRVSHQAREFVRAFRGGPRGETAGGAGGGGEVPRWERGRRRVRRAGAPRKAAGI